MIGGAHPKRTTPGAGHVQGIRGHVHGGVRPVQARPRAGTAGEGQVLQVANSLCSVARRMATRSKGPQLYALELTLRHEIGKLFRRSGKRAMPARTR